MQNREIARLLSETADLMEIAGQDGFRIRSYRNAAAALESYPEQVSLLASDPKKLTEIPGVGKSMAAHIEEILKRGSFERRDELLAKYPPTALELLNIQGLGPKSIALIWEHYRISTVDGLEKLAQEQKLRELPRMGAKLEEKVLRSIASYRRRTGRFLLSFGQNVADELVAYLKDVPGVEEITPAGSLRRGKETIGDLDILVTGAGAEAAIEKFVKHPKVSEVLGRGPNKASVRFGLEGLQVDLRALPRESYGSALLYFTGSKEHNIALRQRALKMGYTLSEYSLAELEGEKPVAGRTEEDVYTRLGLAWIPPELRENTNEMEAAAEGKLPRLLEIGDIQGDLHMHTRESDGRASLREMAAAARELGYRYIAITDHSKSLAMANGLDEKRAIAFARQVETLDELGIRVFSGLECDILRNGRMDLDNEALAALDFVIASVHSHMNLEPAEMTDRLLAAVENPHVRALGHPTGRLLLHRDPYPFDFDRIAAAAAKNNVLMEINASPERLDLSGPMIRLAKSKGCRFVISTDAHHPRHLANMRYGVRTARRGWLEAADVVNTLTPQQFEEVLKTK
ncbi:MAG: DNA polymerase/3'-5' exonuclease PolX [Bryobacteraceae bacterium]|nr:DNA polymerase/3'-5' exonuclease PolX [Bryobacteraceae bacterium]